MLASVVFRVIILLVSLISYIVLALNAKSRILLSHIKDLVPERGLDETAAPAFTNDHQVYRTDAGDIISLNAIGVAEEGGKSRIASSWTVYNELAKSRPDSIHTLSQDWPFQA